MTYTIQKITAGMDLFKAVTNEAFNYCGTPRSGSPIPSGINILDGVKRGFIFVRKSNANTVELIERVPYDLFNAAYGLFGNKTGEFNQTFHKSYGTVMNMSPTEYYIQQLMHYMTTYGAESMGVNIPTYIPTEELEVPENMKPDVDKIVVIQIVSENEFVKKLDTFARNTVAPSNRLVNNFRILIDAVPTLCTDIKSFELQCIACNYRKCVPTNPIQALRYIVYKTTDSTLLIKNARTIKAILASRVAESEIKQLFYLLDYRIWAQIFYRYKPLFLAYKKLYKNDGYFCQFINRIRRAAPAKHIALSDVCVQNALNLAEQERFEDLDRVLNRASNRDIIKILNANMSKNDGMKIYNIRNGRAFVTENKNTNKKSKKLIVQIALYNEVLRRYGEVFKGKTFYIPEYITYSAPTSEKQFIGNLPWGTCVHGPDDGGFVAGIQWYNTSQRERVDIDLHMNSATEHFGWNGGYTNGRSIIYTGDMTDAPLPDGAAEGFWFIPEEKDRFILSANLYYGGKDVTPYFAMSLEKPNTDDIRRRHYTFRNPLFTPIPFEFTDGSNGNTFGMFLGKDFYFCGGKLSNGAVPSGHYENYIEALSSRLKNSYTLDYLISMGGGTVVTTRPEEGDYIDLSPEALTPDTIMNIIDGNI